MDKINRGRVGPPAGRAATVAKSATSGNAPFAAWSRSPSITSVPRLFTEMSAGPACKPSLFFHMMP